MQQNKKAAEKTGFQSLNVLQSTDKTVYKALL